MKILCLIFLVTVCLNLALIESRGINGGLNCAVCTIVTGVIQQKAYLEGVSIYIAARKFCKQLPYKLQVPCYTVVEALEPFLLNKQFLNVFTPDLFCYAIRSCRIDPGENFCHLFPEPHLYKKGIKKLEKVMKEHNVYEILNKLHLQQNFDEEFESETNRIQDITKFVHLSDWENFKYEDSIEFPEVNFCKMPIFKVICDIVIGEFGDLKPAADLDGDGFSILRIARGSDWRGKDCSDINPSVYPGAETKNSDSNIDHNCNGIWGNDPVSGKPWEEILCSDSKSQGIAYIGDSIGAHFHMPESWINPILNAKSSPATIMEILLDEIDWPELGFFSGFMNSSYPDLINGSVDSLYLRMRNLNLCAHRDYQNSARNAALVEGGIKQAEAISRKPSDKPVLVIYAMMGNDVCNRFNDTVENMTTPEDFKKSVLEALNILDKKLPHGSNVVLVSLIDGSFIYPSMAERVHPLGVVFNNIHYKDLYDWYSCMQIGPCNGWMTSNVTLREITTKKAKELSLVLKDISLHSKFDSFQLHFVKNPLNAAIDNWVTHGGKIYEFIDPVDSTHPTQIAQPYMAAALWDSLNELNILGSPNPHNEKIKKIFGDQGGH